MLSVCIITKNEEKNIARCLEALRPLGFEIIVADTGSADATKEIASRYTRNIYDFVWCDDFAAAKNFAVSKASGDVVMVVDADEYMEAFDAEQLAELSRLLKEHPDAVGRVYRKNVFERNGVRQETDEWLNRIFRKDSFHYEGRIHEQVTALDGSDYETFQTPVTLVHTGYDLPEEERKKKAERNIRLLERELEAIVLETAGGKEAAEAAWMMLEEKGGEHSPLQKNEQIPYILYQLGKGWYMAGDYGKACRYFAFGLSFDLNPRLEYVIDMVETYGYALLNSGQAEDALFLKNVYAEFGASADFQFLMGLIYMNNALFDEAVEEFKKATGHRTCRSKGANSYAAWYNIGVIYECLGKISEAKYYYGKCGDYGPAEERLSNL